MDKPPKVVFRVAKLKSFGEIAAAGSHNLRTRPTPNAASGGKFIQVVALDELHFLDDDPETTLAVCQALADSGKRVIVAGLDQDFRAMPFATMSRLLSVAEQVDKLFAICVRCGAYATRSQRLIDGRPAPYNAPTLVVGGLDLYEARCRACFVRPGAEA